MPVLWTLGEADRQDRGPALIAQQVEETELLLAGSAVK